MRDIGDHSTTDTKLRVRVGQKPDVFDMVAEFRNTVVNNKPPTRTMEQEIRMNALKIRPYAGDVFHLNMANSHFIGTLWSILKLEEYLGKAEKELPKKEVRTFYQLMRQYREKFQEQINRIDMRLPHIKSQGIENPVTVEIFRDLGKTPGKRRVH
jgi:hypothetical protein